MSLPFISDNTFKGVDYTKNSLPKAEYDACIFINCNFNESYLSGVSFLECEFVDCNFSSVKTKELMLKDVLFKHCKLLGFPFHDCNPFLFSVRFLECTLNFSSFYNMKLRNTQFKSCFFEETDFTNADLTASIFDHCDLHKVIFENTTLEKVDFKTSKNIIFNPERNTIKKAKFSKENALGLLASYFLDIE